MSDENEIQNFKYLSDTSGESAAGESSGEGDIGFGGVTAHHCVKRRVQKAESLRRTTTCVLVRKKWKWKWEWKMKETKPRLFIYIYSIFFFILALYIYSNKW